MASKAVLEIEGKRYNILEFNYKLTQEAGRNGFPCGNVMGGHIIIVLESDKGIETFDWAKNHNLQKEGTISFYNHDGMSIFKKLTFREAYCFLYHEEFYSNGKQAMRHTIEISPGNTNYHGINFTKDWSEPVFEVKNASTFVEEEEDKEKLLIINFHADSSEVESGKFGYDKFDEGFKKIYTGKDFSSFENEYKPIQVYGEKYFPVWVSMRKGQTITLNLDIIKRKNPKLFNDIKFEDNADFTFEPANLKDAKQVHITCNNTNSSTAQIKLEGDGTTVGAINIFYPEPKEVKVRWVVVDFNKGDKGKINADFNSDKLGEYFKKAFNPALINVKVVNDRAESLEIIQPTINLLEKSFIDRVKMNLETGKKDSVKQTDSNKTNLLANLNSLHLTKQNRESNDEIYLYLTNLKSGSQKESATDSENIEILSNNGATYKNICIMFLGNENKFPDVEIPHEIMHAMGLPHTFKDKDLDKPKKHTFKQKATKNYMDYALKKEYTWFWQWQQLH